MALDNRSLERLRELGRTLPKPLPKPEAPPPAPKASDQRHKLETETNPEALFRELMQASPDGTVPPHLMARLKELEASRSPRRSPGRAGSAAPVDTASRTTSPRPVRARSSEEESLYTAFQQLLLEDDEP